MTRGQMTTYGPRALDDDDTLVQVGKKTGPSRVIEPPVLEEGVDIGNLIEAEESAKQGLVRSLNSARTYMKKLQQAQQDAGVWCAPRGVANPVSAIGGSNVTSNLADELDKLFTRYVAAMRKGVESTLEGLNQPLS